LLLGCLPSTPPEEEKEKRKENENGKKKGKKLAALTLAPLLPAEYIACRRPHEKEKEKEQMSKATRRRCSRLQSHQIQSHARVYTYTALVRRSSGSLKSHMLQVSDERPKLPLHYLSSRSLKTL
jgi:hypothetical protein